MCHGLGLAKALEPYAVRSISKVWFSRVCRSLTDGGVRSIDLDQGCLHSALQNLCHDHHVQAPRAPEFAMNPAAGALCYDATPALHVPLRFLLTAPLFGIAAGLLLLAAPDALSSRWEPTAFALTHLLAVGFML